MKYKLLHILQWLGLIVTVNLATDFAVLLNRNVVVMFIAPTVKEAGIAAMTVCLLLMISIINAVIVSLLVKRLGASLNGHPVSIVLIKRRKTDFSNN